ncbi:MAG: hypothetical protein HOW97_16185 [Catenulispora sp.]|nr:hypothetical protein [Catenulispora sp.]
MDAFWLLAAAPSREVGGDRDPAAGAFDADAYWLLAAAAAQQSAGPISAPLSR